MAAAEALSGIVDLGTISTARAAELEALLKSISTAAKSARKDSKSGVVSGDDSQAWTAAPDHGCGGFGLIAFFSDL